MAKAGMRRPNVEEPHGDEAAGKKQRFSKNEVSPVPEIQEKAKNGKKKAGPM